MSASIECTTGICLRRAPYSRTSLVAVWLTPQHGRLTTLLKGALRPRSDFLGQCDLFCTSEVLFYSRETNGIHVAGNCLLQRSRVRMREDWRAFLSASWTSEVLLRSTLHGARADDLFGLWSTYLDWLEGGGACLRALLWFELQCAALSGVRPQLERCTTCGRGVQEGADVGFAPARGGVVCARCETAAGAAVMPLSRREADFLSRLLAADDPAAAHNDVSANREEFTVAHLLGSFMQFHMDVDTTARDMAAGALQSA
jgi:DNA repair protein RecO (recombination protein O)